MTTVHRQLIAHSKNLNVPPHPFVTSRDLRVRRAGLFGCHLASSSSNRLSASRLFCNPPNRPGASSTPASSTPVIPDSASSTPASTPVNQSPAVVLQQKLHAEIAWQKEGGGGSSSSAPRGETTARVCDLIDQCRSHELRAFSELSQLALSVDCTSLNPSSLTNVLHNLSALGCLVAPLYMSASSSLRNAELSDGDLVRAAQSYATQRVRDSDLFESWRPQMARMSPADQVRVRHACASLNIPSTLRPEMKDLPLNMRAMLAEAILLGDRDVAELLSIVETLEVNDETKMSKATHRRLLLLRHALKYLYKDTYVALPTDQKNMMREMHQRDLHIPMLKCTSFVDKLSAVLTKLRIAHRPRVLRGPFVFDILERDRKVVYETNHKDRFYALTFDKIAARSLQERIVKAMGYRVVQIPYWHWNKLRLKRTRIEYIRMSRYYAIKDRREYATRDEEFLGEYFFKKDRPVSPFAWSTHKRPSASSLSATI